MSMPARARIGAAKLGAAAIISIVLSVLFYAVNLLCSAQVWGLSDLSRPIQSIEAFRTCVLRLSVGEYLCVIFLFKCLVAVMLSAIVCMLYALLRKAVLVLGTLTVFVGVEAALYVAIKSSSLLNALRFVNIVEWINAYDIFANYQNINILTRAVNSLSASLVVITLLLALSCAVTVFMYATAGITRKSLRISFLEGLHTAFIRFADRLAQHTSTFLHEAKKLFFTQKARGVLVLLCAALIYGYTGASRFMIPEEKAYSGYMEEHAGLVDEHTLENLNAEVERQQNMKGLTELRDVALAAVMRIIEQTNKALAMYENDGVPPYIIDESGYLRLFSPKEGTYYAVIMLITTTLCLSTVLSQESDKKLLIRTTAYGYRRSMLAKGLLCAGISVLVCAAVTGAQWATIAKNYTFGYTEAPVRCLTDNIHGISETVRYMGSSTILSYMLMLFGTRLIGACVLGCVLMALSSLMQSAAAAISLGMLVCVAPVLAVMVGLESVGYFSLLPLLSGNMALQVTKLYSLLTFGIYGAAAALVLRKKALK